MDWQDYRRVRGHIPAPPLATPSPVRTRRERRSAPQEAVKPKPSKAAGLEKPKTSPSLPPSTTPLTRSQLKKLDEAHAALQAAQQSLVAEGKAEKAEKFKEVEFAARMRGLSDANISVHSKGSRARAKLQKAKEKEK